MLDLEPHEARLLLDVALMAIGQNRFEIASKMIATLKLFRPKAESLASAEAILLLSRGLSEEAIFFINRELSENRFPDSAMLKVFKGLAFLKANRLAEAHEILNEVAANGNDPIAVRMAKDLLT